MNAKRIAIRELNEAGFVFDRHGGNHDLYFNHETNEKIPVRHSFKDSDLRMIRKEIEISKSKRESR